MAVTSAGIHIHCTVYTVQCTVLCLYGSLNFRYLAISSTTPVDSGDSGQTYFMVPNELHIFHDSMDSMVSENFSSALDLLEPSASGRMCVF